MTATIQTAYTDHVEALKALGSTLSAAVAVRYIAPPSMTPQPSISGIPNPTLDIVLDTRRSFLSDEVTRAMHALQHITAQAEATNRYLLSAIGRWEGTHPGDPAT